MLTHTELLLVDIVFIPFSSSFHHVGPGGLHA